jgi:acetylornithine deacetylase/succinyl-diaminopimelate desuccinylase-like protein
MQTSIDLSNFQSYFEKNKDACLKFYSDLLKIPSISTDPKHQSDCKKAALFIEDFLKNLEFKTELHEENKNYLVFAEKIIDPKLPTLCFYGHTDVQPCDPLDLWDTPPFEPTIKDGKMYARGAQDNKGQLCYVLLAIKAYLELEGQKTCNLKLIIEGEEESGSHGTELILHKIKSKLKCDELYVVDFDAKSETVPSIVLGMRGLCAFEFTIKNASTDLHSGMYGGVVYNPLRAISEMIADCFNQEGKLAFHGAYEELQPLEKADLDAIDFSFDAEYVSKTFDVQALSIPENVKPREANWLLPTFEVNGLFGGYTQDGVKTVLPKMATAKISCRLGKGQDPIKFIEAARKHLEKSMPKGFKLEFKIHQAASSFYTTLHASSVQKAKGALEQVFNHNAWIGLSGASVPIVGLLSKLCTSNVALMGVGLDTDNIHAPNEHFSLERFRKGFLSVIHILKSTK